MSSYAPIVPVTAAFAFPFTLYYIFLQGRVVFYRVRSKTTIGQESTVKSERDPLLAAVRAQGNFFENVPLALILAGLVELNGSNATQKPLIWTLGSLLVFRILHAEAGVMREGYKGKGRPLGFLGTLAINIGLACWAAASVFPYWVPGGASTSALLSGRGAEL